MLDDIATRLREVRSELGASTATMAKKAGLKNRKSWEGYESGDNSPKVDVIRRLAEFGYNPTWIITGQGPKYLVDLAGPSVSPSTPIDTRVLQEAVELVEDWLEEHDRVMPANKKAEVVAAIYEMAFDVADEDQPSLKSSQVGRILRLVS